MSIIFRDRTEGGKELAKLMRRYRDRDDVVILALPRGGVVTGAAVAEALGAPLDIIVARKLGTPGEEELAMGAVARGVRVLNDEVIAFAGVNPEQIEQVAARELDEVERRENIYRAGKPPIPLEGKVVALVDDGLATGATIRAAIAAVRRERPQRIVVAVPVAPPEIVQHLGREVDEVICVSSPARFTAVGLWYESFTQVTDDEVIGILARERVNS